MIFGFSVFVPKNFGFGDYCDFVVSVLFRSRFSAKIKSGFRICFWMQFGVFPVSLRKTCASTACTSSLVLLGVDKT